MFTRTALSLVTATVSHAAHAQLQIDWYTIDGGGGTSTGGGISITGTIGQHDAATSVGGGIECAGGFWPGVSGSAACYPNCDGSTTSPILNANDFICFINACFTGCS